MKPELICILLLTIAVPISGNWAAAEPAGIDDPDHDSIEYQLEIRGHQALSAVKNNPSNQINEFTTDGCSGGLSVGWQYLAGKLQKFDEVHGVQPPWESCCTSHDRNYHSGGGRRISAEQSFVLRLNADQQLKSCVQKKGLERSAELSSTYAVSSEDVELLYAVISNLMYRAVRIGGVPCSGLPWRWGYGWPECE